MLGFQTFLLSFLKVIQPSIAYFQTSKQVATNSRNETKSMKFLLFLFLVFQVPFLKAQEEFTLRFCPKMGADSLILNTDYKRDSTELFRIETLRFYISEIRFLKNNKVVYQESESYHLIDVDREESLTLHFNKINSPDFDAILFNIGIDSTTNVGGALGGDLDPTMGMYWSWQSGYINFKLEGYTPNCTARNHVFEYHLGGYMEPNNALSTIQLSTPPMVQSVVIDFNLEAFLAQLDVVHLPQVMSPSAHAVNLSQKLIPLFSIRQ